MNASVFFGTAGWSYADWKGIVYPRGLADRDQLAFAARFLDCLEVNVSFYRIPAAKMVQGWLDKTAEKPVPFLVKLWQGFTHRGPGSFGEDEVSEFRAGIEPLLDAERCPGLLAQFPYSFRATHENARHVADLRRRFADTPLVVEVRHRSWWREDVISFLKERGCSFCNIDQPQGRNSLAPTDAVTAPLGYVRLHGRNSAAWFRRESGRDERYDYLYGDEELDEWIERIETMRGHAEAVFVIANNHFEGQAFANALELKVLAGGRDVVAPEPLVERYPRLLARGIRGTP
ncbi:MAG: DUF72 domain-containing protein [Planctomycetota bacterium]